MQEWLYAIQKLVDYIEEHACENPSLIEISEHISYGLWNRMCHISLQKDERAEATSLPLYVTPCFILRWKVNEFYSP